MKNLRIPRLLAAGALASSIAFGLGASPAHSAPATSIEPGWVTYPLPRGVDPGLTTQQQVQGRSVGTGCLFSFTGTATPGSPGREWDQVAFDAATCRAVYAIGPIQHAGPADSAGDSSQSDGAGGGQTRRLAHATGTTLAFFMKTFYEDPVGIDVSSLRNDVEWTYSGGCNTSYKWKRNATWYTPTGWYLRYANDSPSFGCSNAISNSDALMENDIFPACLSNFESAYTHYNYNHQVAGRPNGTVVYTWNDYVDSSHGICYRLLSHHNTQGFESPW